LVILTYLTTLALFLWSSFKNIGNPAVVQISDVDGYGYLEIVVVCLILTYIGYLSYYLVRALGHCGRFRRKYSIRFIVIGAFSFFAVVSMLGVTVIQDRTRYTTEATTFFISHAIIYLYFGSLAHFFTPSGTPEPERVEPSETQKKEKPDSHFDKPAVVEEPNSQAPVPDIMKEAEEMNEFPETQFDSIPRGQVNETMDSMFETSNENPYESNNSMKVAEIEDENF
jgi:hypothetical protein